MTWKYYGVVGFYLVDSSKTKLTSKNKEYWIILSSRPYASCEESMIQFILSLPSR